jgi:hypothetical protein
MEGWGCIYIGMQIFVFQLKKNFEYAMMDAGHF